MPKILRIDGKAFHTFLRHAVKPYDKRVMDAMVLSAADLMAEMGGTARMAYIQSDECSVVINDGISQNSQPWFDNNIQKIVSVAACTFGNSFNGYYQGTDEDAAFDARIFVLPDLTELTNNLIWRQQDATRNSIQTYGRAYFSQAEMHGLRNDDVQAKLLAEHDTNWNDFPTWTKRGAIVRRVESPDYEIPIFTTDREYISKLYLPYPDEQQD